MKKETEEYVKKLIINDIELLADDVSMLFDEDEKETPIKQIEKIVDIAKEFEIDFWDIIKNNCSLYEQMRLKYIFENDKIEGFDKYWDEIADSIKNSNSNNVVKKSKECKHILVKSGESAKCSFCSEHFGWFCPSSPDKQCYYFSKEEFDGYYVTLLDGTQHKITHHYTKMDSDNENEDCCIFCGGPDERK